MKRQLDITTSAGLLLLRVAAGGMLLLGHGWGKLVNFGDLSAKFPDPVGLGSGFSLALAVFAETICAALVVLGIGTRLAAMPVVILLLVAAVVIHGDDPWAKKEFALIYAIPFLTLIFTGPGPYSVDRWIWKKRSPDTKKPLI